MNRFIIYFCLVFLHTSLSQAAVTINVEEVGGDVVATSSGTINTDGFAFIYVAGGSVAEILGTGTYPDVYCVVGTGSATPQVYGYGVLGWANGNNDVCTTSSGEIASSNNGDYVAVRSGKNLQLIEVPLGYVSGGLLSGSSTWAGASFATLQLIPGVYVYEWGSGETADSLTLIIKASPEEQIVILIIQIDDLVDSGILTGGQGNALSAKLKAALIKLDQSNALNANFDAVLKNLGQGKPNVAVNILNAFINQVLSLIDDGVLTFDEGEVLINAADFIIDEILTPDTVQYDEQQDGDISGVFGSGPVFQLGVGTNIIEGNGNGLPADPTLFDFDIFSIVIPNGHSLTSISLEEWGPPALANPDNFFWRIRPGTQQPVSYQWSVSAASFLGSTLATIAADVAAIPLNLDAYTINNSGSLATGGLPYRWVFVIE